MGEWLQLRAEDGHELSGYLAKPEGKVRGGLVVVQEIFGVNGHIRSVADSYAREGYLALAPALFDRIEPGVQLSYDTEDMQKAFGLYGKLNPETALLDVAAAFQHVTAQGGNGAVLGFCFGGLMAWLSATRGQAAGLAPKCTVGFYAGGIGKVAEEQPSCPVMLHFGEQDSHIGMDQVDAVRHAHPDVQVFLYSGAGHAFNRDVDPGSFHTKAAALARERTLAFLSQNLG